MDNKIKVSVIMPVYNSGEYLKTAVESILNQSLKEIELILVDDGSTDGSSERCDEYAAKDSRVVVIHQKNGGICNARNVALKIARGEYIGFSDHDDAHHQDMLKDNYEFAIKNKLDFVKYCKKSIEIKNGKVILEWQNHIKKQIITRNQLANIIFQLADDRFHSCVWDALFKRVFLLDNNIEFDPYFKQGGEDYNFINKCFQHVSIFGTNDKCYYYHYIRYSISTSTKKNPEILNVIKRLPYDFLKTLQSLDVNPSDRSVDYTYFITKYYISSVVRNVLRTDWNEDRKIDYLKGIKDEPFYFDFIEKTYLNIIRHKAYFVMHLLFKLHLYKVLLLAYKYVHEK